MKNYKIKHDLQKFNFKESVKCNKGVNTLQHSLQDNIFNQMCEIDTVIKMFNFPQK